MGRDVRLVALSPGVPFELSSLTVGGTTCPWATAALEVPPRRGKWEMEVSGKSMCGIKW